MADLKISALTSATTPLAGTEVFPIVQSGATVKATINSITAGRSLGDNIGVGTAPFGWAAYKSFDIGTQGSFVSVSTQVQTIQNALYNGAWVYKADGFAANYNIVSGQHVWQRAASGLAGGAVTWIEDGRFDENGNLSVANGNFVVGTSGKGIDFSATSGSGTSELLADYEEGTWTPTLTDLTNNATIASATCSYTKVGRMVTVMGYLETGGLGSVSGNIYIGGLPFAQVNNAGGLGAGSIGYAANMNLLLGQSVTLASESNQTYMSLRLWDALTGTTAMQASEWANNGAVVFTCTYRAT
jgi:hypothetical protein